MPRPPEATTRVFALPERTGALRNHASPTSKATGSNIPTARSSADFSGLPDYVIDGSKLRHARPSWHRRFRRKRKTTVDDILALRDQQIIYRITKDLLRDHFSDETGNHEFHRFHELMRHRRRVV